MDASYLPNLLWDKHLHTASEVAKRLLAGRDELLDERDSLHCETASLRVKLGELSAELVRSTRGSRPGFAERAQEALGRYGQHRSDCNLVFKPSG
jgi:hypothetical protein